MNAKTLLKKYFGDKIINAVKSKLLQNIENMNANSAFSDRFEFRGGVTAENSDTLNEKQHTAIFKWNSQSQLEENWNTIQDDYWGNIKVYESVPVYRTTVTEVQTTYKDKVTSKAKAAKNWENCGFVEATYIGNNGSKYTESQRISSTKVSRSVKDLDTYEFYTDKTHMKQNLEYTKYHDELVNTVDHYNAVVENVKYKDADKWTESFEPTTIKFKIN